MHAMLQHSMLMTMLIPLISPLLLLKWQRLLRCWLPWRAVLPLYLSLNACGDAVGAVQHVVVVVLDRPPMGWMVVSVERTWWRRCAPRLQSRVAVLFRMYG